jgi:preprotein translocase subunit SecB
VGRVARRVQIAGVELLGAHFERADDQAIPTSRPVESTPEIGIDVSWSLAEEGNIFGCVLTFGTLFESDPPYNVIARFRLLYSVGEGDELSAADLEQFAHWNAMFNAWPYWREYLSSTVNRANLPRFIVPVMGVPLVK